MPVVERRCFVVRAEPAASVRAPGRAVDFFPRRLRFARGQGKPVYRFRLDQIVDTGFRIEMQQCRHIDFGIFCAHGTILSTRSR